MEVVCMDTTNPIVVLLGVAGIALLIWYGLLPLWMYNRVRGIERAMWAIVSQLQRSNRNEHVVDPAATARAHEVSSSMFGR
jgi:hypothetical protein